MIQYMTSAYWKVAFFTSLVILSGWIFLQRSGWLQTAPECKGCNVILISLDQVRAKSLPCFGYSQNSAPNLCRFADSSFIFTNAYATASRTLDAHFSMITSLYPSTHGMNLPYATKLSPSVPTLAELLKKEGYNTYFFGPEGDPHLPIGWGLERGFDQTFAADNPGSWIRTMDTIATQTAKLKQPSFFFMHTYDAHEPYMPDAEDIALFYDGSDRKLMSYDDLCYFTYSKLMALHPDIVVDTPKDSRPYCKRLDAYTQNYIEDFNDYNDTYAIFNDRYWHQFDDLSTPEKARYTHALYVAAIYLLDIQLGEFFTYLEKKGMMQNSIIIIVGDQGDEFFEHGSYSHGWSLYNEVLHVPFIVYVPHSTPKKSQKLVSQVDILPTIFSLLRKPVTVSIAGIDMFSRKIHTMILAEHVSDGALALRTSAYTLIRRIVGDGFQIELYDVKNDPEEKHNVYKGNTQIVKSLFNEYKALQSGFPKYLHTPAPLPTWIGENDRKSLIESGYF